MQMRNRIHNRNRRMRIRIRNCRMRIRTCIRNRRRRLEMHYKSRPKKRHLAFRHRSSTSRSSTTEVRHRHCIRPQHFNGAGSFESFWANVENCAAYNKWTEADKLAHLKASLMGVRCSDTVGHRRNRS